MHRLPLMCLPVLLAAPVAGQTPATPTDKWLSDLEHPRSDAGRQAFREMCATGSQAFLPVIADLNAHLDGLGSRALHGAPRFTLPETIQPNPSDPSQHTLGTFEPDPESVLDIGPGQADPEDHWLFTQDRGLEPGECRALASVLWLSHQESGAAAALPLLLKLLDHPRRELVEEAARAIVAIGPPVARPLTDLLHDRQRGWVAATILGHLGPLGFEVLEEELAVDDRRTRLRALFGMGLAAEHGSEQTWRLVGRYLGSLDMVLTRLAAWSLSRAGSPALPLLQETLTEGKPLARAHATCALGLMGPPAREAISAILDQLRRETSTIGQWSAEALGRIAPGSEGSEEAVDALLAIAQTANLPLRLACLRALGSFREHAQRIVPRMRTVLREADAFERFHAVQAILSLGEPAAEAWPDIRALAARAEWRDLQVLAVEAMGAMDAGAVPDLARSLEEPHLRGVAIESLRELGGETVTPALLAMLTDGEAETRCSAARALAVAEVAALVGRDALPALETAREDTDADVRAAAEKALEHIKERAPMASDGDRRPGGDSR